MVRLFNVSNRDSSAGENASELEAQGYSNYEGGPSNLSSTVFRPDEDFIDEEVLPPLRALLREADHALLFLSGDSSGAGWATLQTYFGYTETTPGRTTGEASSGASGGASGEASELPSPEGSGGASDKPSPEGSGGASDRPSPEDSGENKTPVGTPKATPKKARGVSFEESRVKINAWLRSKCQLREDGLVLRFWRDPKVEHLRKLTWEPRGGYPILPQSTLPERSVWQNIHHPSSSSPVGAKIANSCATAYKNLGFYRVDEEFSIIVILVRTGMVALPVFGGPGVLFHFVKGPYAEIGQLVYYISYTFIVVFPLRYALAYMPHHEARGSMWTLCHDILDSVLYIVLAIVSTLITVLSIAQMLRA